MPNQIVGEVDVLRIINLLVTFATPLLVLLLTLTARDRRRALDDRLDGIEKTINNNVRNIEQQLRDIRQEAIAGRKECADDVRAIMTQLREYPRRDEVQGLVGDLRQEARARWRQE